MEALNKVVEIDLNTFHCNTLPPMKEERGAVKACYFQNKLFVVGGGKKNIAGRGYTTGYTPASSLECFDFNSNWRNI